MACRDCAARGRMLVVGTATETVRWSPMALACDSLGFAPPHRVLTPPRASHPQSHPDASGEWCHHAGELIFLVGGLPKHRDAPEALLRSAGALWIANVLVFALWYWRLDAGGPHERDRLAGRSNSSFLFPQMLIQDNADPEIKRQSPLWSPHFVDYLFLAFNTSAAFSPADTAVLSRRAKLGMMTQALISLSIVVLLAARGVGIL
jgi:hypothetical protein